MVEEDAKLLYKSGEKRIGTDEKTFIRIFSERSSTHLAAVNSAYTSFGKSLEKVMCSQVVICLIFDFII
jgi:annexin D